jgi:hypothetical protein
MKIFARGFYRKNAGLLLVLFLGLFGIVPPSEWYSYQKNLMLGLLARSHFLYCLFAFWLAYGLRAMVFIRRQLVTPSCSFLFYSLNGLPLRHQFKHWLVVQQVILLPVTSYALLMAFVGLYNHLYLAIAEIFIFLAGLAADSAAVCVILTKNIPELTQRRLWPAIITGGPKFLCSIYLGHLGYQLKFSLAITKIFSCLIITGFILLAGRNSDPVVAALSVLSVVTAHSVLLYQKSHFETTSLDFMKNLPSTYWTIAANLSAVFMVVSAPEAIWLFARFPLATALRLLILMLGLALFYYLLVYHLDSRMSRYLRWVAGIYMFLFVLLLAKLTGLVILVSLVSGFWLAYRKYALMAE